MQGGAASVASLSTEREEEVESDHGNDDLINDA